MPKAERMSRIELRARPRILVIALRRLGDVLLTTPLITSLRRAFPDATIDALVFDDTAGILQGNADINNIVIMPVRRSPGRSLRLALKMWRQYDLAVSTQSGDRPTYFAIIAGRQRAAPVETRLGGRIKRRFLTHGVGIEKGVHRVEEMLRLADALGIERESRVVAPERRGAPQAPAGRYAVIHAAPMFRYKQWMVEGWRALAAALLARGLTVVATGGPSVEERKYLDSVWAGSGMPVTRLDGVLDWVQLTGLLAKARVYVGPDTSVTHLAAATGCPTVALYGPTDPRLWGPWPVGGLDTMWAASGEVQQRGNVWLVQNPLPCMPCQLEGCERRLGSHSACLDELSPVRVIQAVEQALEFFPTPAHAH
jgi:heptosyltransferase-3